MNIYYDCEVHKTRKTFLLCIKNILLFQNIFHIDVKPFLEKKTTVLLKVVQPQLNPLSSKQLKAKIGTLTTNQFLIVCHIPKLISF